LDTINCETSAELAEALESLAPGMLFRGQTQEYLRTDGGPDLRSSIDRHGCIPNRMLKWWQYSRFILGTYIKAFEVESDLATDQAILQHYGWRSFFLDASSSSRVAAWFAGHKYRTKRAIELVEDCWEDPVFAIREEAWYEDADEQTGCLYVIGRKGLRRNGIECVDLVEIATEQGQHRCGAQSAFMVGPLSGNLPDDCVVTKIHAPTKVFREFAAEDLSLNQSLLFPGQRSDPFLATLMSVPWVKRYGDGDDVSINFYDRGLGLPEYDLCSMKRNGSEACFYRRFWLADALSEDSLFAQTDFYLTGEGLFHGTTDGTNTFPNITRLLRETASVTVEIDGLIRYPYAAHGSFAKGIYLELQENGSLLLTELSVEQHGLRPVGFGIAKGIYYEPNDSGIWTKVSHPEECDCGHNAHHNHHLVVASHFENLLQSGDFRKLRERVLTTPDVDPTSDKGALDWMVVKDTKNND